MDLEHQPGGEGLLAPIISDEDFFTPPSSPIGFSDGDPANAIELIGGEDEEKSHQIAGGENATRVGFEGEFRRELLLARRVLISEWLLSQCKGNIAQLSFVFY